MHSVLLHDAALDSFVHIQPLDLDQLTNDVLTLFDCSAPLPLPVSLLPAEPAAALPPDAENYAAHILLVLGIPAHVHGYKYLRYAILASLEDETVLESLSHSLYPLIARRFSASACQVERSIRHAIEMAWRKQGPAAFEALCPQGCFYNGAYPTVHEFIALASAQARIHLSRSRCTVTGSAAQSPPGSHPGRSSAAGTASPGKIPRLPD